MRRRSAFRHHRSHPVSQSARRSGTVTPAACREQEPEEEHERPKTVALGNIRITRFILGGNPFSGFAHQTVARDNEMVDWFTMERVKETYRQAEQAGVTTHIGRADHFIQR